MVSINQVDGKVQVTLPDSRVITLEDWEVLEFRKFANDTFRFCNKERYSDLPLSEMELTDVEINGETPATFEELNDMLNELFPTSQDQVASGGGSPGGGLLQVATVTLTDAQIKDLRTNPIQLVAAPGAGKYIQLMSGSFWIDCTEGAYGNVHSEQLTSGLIFQIPAGNIRQAIYAGNAWQFEDDSAVTWGSIIPRFEVPLPSELTGEPISVTDYLSSVENSPLQVGYTFDGGAGALTGGNASNTMKITVYYVIVDV